MINREQMWIEGNYDTRPAKVFMQNLDDFGNNYIFFKKVKILMNKIIYYK